ncbi:hypothetical protein ACFZCY_43245 [Streptomyces sp. NPDC007983]|uniref:hypothetical protein n=1 Tax=Streptomyces sp. NPDC007983 TaxID=3364800 RepID=UPI0036E92B93
MVDGRGRATPAADADEVAERVGVSRSVVFRVLSNAPHISRAKPIATICGRLDTEAGLVLGSTSRGQTPDMCRPRSPNRPLSAPRG